MKTCVVRKRFWSTETANQTIKVDLPPNFGVPLACMIYFTETSAGTDAFDTTTANRNFGIGLVGPPGDGTTTLRYHCSWIAVGDGANPTTVGRKNSNTDAIYTQSVGLATTYYRCTAIGFTTDAANFTFANYTPQTNAHLDTILWFINGSDVTVGIGTHGMPQTAGGSNSFSGFNFQPDVMFFASPITALNAGLTDDCRMSLGAATRSPFKQGGTYWHFEGASSTVDLGAMSSSTAAINYSTSNAVGPYTMTINSIDATGFTMTSSAAAAGANNFLMFLGIQSNDPSDFALVNTFSSATTTGVSFSSLGSSGFIPETMVGSMTNATAFGTRVTTSPGADSINVFAGFATSDSKYYPGFGTLTSSTGSTVLTGTGTSFYRLSPGDKVYNTSYALIGTINQVTSNSNAYLTANASVTVSPTASFVYSVPSQYCISFGDEDGSTGSKCFSKMSSFFVNSSRSSAGSPTDLVQAYLDDFDSRPGYELNFVTVDASARIGWIMAFKNQAIARRRRDSF
jgi:hypothetical protein